MFIFVEKYNRMKGYRFIVFIILIACFSSCALFNKDRITAKRGVSGIEIFKSTRDDVIEKYGDPVDSVIWGTFSVELVYDGKISFTYLEKDRIKIIKYITLYAPFRGKTARGLRLNKRLRVNKVIETYGPAKWDYSEDSTQLFFAYRGITFGIKANEKYTAKYFKHTGEYDLPRFDSLHTALYLNAKIEEITVGK